MSLLGQVWLFPFGVTTVCSVMGVSITDLDFQRLITMEKNLALWDFKNKKGKKLCH